MTRFHALNEFIALDFETSGFSPETDTVIDIGAIRYAEGKEVGRFSTLVNPQKMLPYEIIQLTGISNEDLASAPVLADVREHFREFLGDVPIMAHNAKFELQFLQHIFGTTYKPQMLDSCHLVGLCYPLAASLSLEYFIRLFGLRDYEHHRGLQDALDMVAIVQRVDEELNKPEFAPLCAIVQHWFQNSEMWLWKPFFTERHAQAKSPTELPAYRNFKALYAEQEVGTIPENLTQAPARLKEHAFFATEYERYQLRDSQQKMAEKAAQTLHDGGIYVSEAGTGTGKTLAYLTAALAGLAENSESPVVISTHTKALQNQFLQQELPRLQRLFNLPDLRAVVLKGMNNYACLRKMNDLLPTNDEYLFSDNTDDLFAGAFLMHWALKTQEGEIEELPKPFFEFFRIERAAREARADYRDCTRSECKFYTECLYFKKQWESASASILAVNHSLLLTYPRSYPEFDRLIVDEADELGTEAIEAFSNIASYNQLYDLQRVLTQDNGIIAQIYREINNFLNLVQTTKKVEQAKTALTKFNLTSVLGLQFRFTQVLTRLNNVMSEIRAEDLFTVQATLNDTQRINTTQRTTISTELSNLRVIVAELLQEASTLLKIIGDIAPSPEELPSLREFQYRVEDTEKVYKTIVQFLEQNEHEAALYVRIEKTDWSIVATPYNIGELFASEIVAKLYAAVFTSATISSTRDMQDFIKGMGLNTLSEKPLYTSRFKSPFDYKHNSRLVFLKNFPANNHPSFAKQAAEFIANAAEELHGRILVLFTSKLRQKSVHDELFPLLRKHGIELISHGITNNSQHKCVEQFKLSSAAVLMGARGLWKGVDIPGDDLQCLILEKMPYAVPNPFTKGLQEAKIEQYKQQALERGEMPDVKRLSQIAWNEVDKPMMFQAFRQMFGRLIRTETDKGVMFVLDSQLQSGNLTPRHKQLVELLPDVPYQVLPTNVALETIKFLK